MLIPPWVKPALYGTAVVALSAALIVQTVRLEGFKVWPFSIEGANPRAERLQRTIDNIEQAQQAAAEKARLARLEQERKYRELANAADQREAEIREDAMDDAERYIAANRVRPQGDRSTPGVTGTSAEGRSPEGDHGPGAETELDDGLVAVTAEDVRICTRNTARLIAAREWGLGL